MAKKLLRERYIISEEDVRRLTIRYTGVLDRGENLTGEPVFDDTSGDLEFSDATINSVPVEVFEKRTPSGQALSFKLQGQTKANAPYRFGVQVPTSKGQLIGCDILLDVE